MSVSNPDKVVTKQDLADFYEQIKPYLGSYPVAIANKFSKGDIYSTTEKLVGQFTDGKPIYQKTFTDTLPNCTTNGTEVSKTISIGASIDKIIGYDGFAVSSSNSIIPLVTYTYSDANNKFVRVQFFNNSASSNANCISLRNAWTSYNGASVYITIRYTKTTDSSTSIGDENDYSTSEKIVGTWIDSKPIYQKTFTGTLPTCSVDGTEVSTQIAIGATVADVINITGRMKKANANTFMGSMFGQFNSSTFLGYRLFAGDNSASSTYKNKINISNTNTNWNGETIYITLQYTKTT